MRKRFFAAFADNVLKYYDNRGVTRYVPVNAEGGFVPFLYRLGFLTQAELDSWQAQMVTDVAAAGVTSTRMMVNLAYGGREQYGFAKAGWEAGAELATHGPDSILTLPFAQYLRARYYDPTYKAYRPVAGAEDTFRFHTDLEVLNRTPASGLQYRLFRLFAFGALALGADSLLVTAGTLPSGAYGSTYGRDDTCPPLSDKAALWKHWETYGESARDCYYDAAEVAEHNGVSFLDWLNRSIARPAASAAEATCNFTQTGVDFATTSTAGTLLSHISTTASATTTPPSLATLVGRDYALDRSTGEYTAYGRTREEEAVVTPIVKYHGRLCDLLPAAGVSRASRKFETTYSAAFAATSGASGVASADLDPRVFGEAHIGLEGNAAGGAIYEGRSVAPHPMNVGLTALSPAIMVSLSPAFLARKAPTNGYQVKVMFSHPSGATSTSLGVQYWCGGAETRTYATYDGAALTADKVYTASFSVPASCLLAPPSATAPSGAHLAVLVDGGASPDIMTVRVIRDE